MTDTATTADERAEAFAVANVINRQIGVWALASVGAHQLSATHRAPRENHAAVPGMTFLARLHFRGQTRVRITRVYVLLTVWDLYDVVCVVNGEERYRIDDVDCEALAGVITRLDSEGI